MNNFIEEMKILNHEEIFQNEREKLKEKLTQKEPLRKAGVSKFMESFDEWYTEFLVEWDECLQRCVIAAVKNGHKEKMKLELGVFNFSNEKIPEEAWEILKLGKKSVPPVDKGTEAAVKTFETELRNYLKAYRMKVERKPHIQQGITEEMDVKIWLENAIADEQEENSEHKKFYKELLQNLDQAYAHVEREAHSSGKTMTALKLHNKI